MKYGDFSRQVTSALMGALDAGSSALVEHVFQVRLSLAGRQRWACHMLSLECPVDSSDCKQRPGSGPNRATFCCLAVSSVSASWYIVCFAFLDVVYVCGGACKLRFNRLPQGGELLQWLVGVPAEVRPLSRRGMSVQTAVPRCVPVSSVAAGRESNTCADGCDLWHVEAAKLHWAGAQGLCNSSCHCHNQGTASHTLQTSCCMPQSAPCSSRTHMQQNPHRKFLM